jgi:hypothetical protein
VFGKANSGAINLSAIADASNPTGGFVINGEAGGYWNGYSVSSAGDVKLPAPVCSSALILLALMRILSLPDPALNTSMPPLVIGMATQSPAQAMSTAMVWMI